MNQFLPNVLKGLNAPSKYLHSKYFYDKKGDELFQQIMACDDYYLTRSEMEIFSKQKEEIVDLILKKHSKIDVIEFGAGDAIKSFFLLEELKERDGLGTYFPIDISGNIIQLLEKTIPSKIPGINIHGFEGEYFDMLQEAGKISKNPKIILFVGANIGNFKFNEMRSFLKEMQSSLSPDDLVLIGFDLKKEPKKILRAYDDRAGITSEFNLNLLHRINRELNANFVIANFEHYATYDPQTGACRSFLVSLKDQKVQIENDIIHFKQYEPIFMEVSQKYSLEDIASTAAECGFETVSNFFDKENNFVDVIWTVKGS